MSATSLSPVPIAQWLEENRPAMQLLWREGFWNQVTFVRHRLHRLMSGRCEAHVDIDVISTHTSKSIMLPVYRMSRPDVGITLILRNNFYNWKMSVITTRHLHEVDSHFAALFHTSPPIDPEYTGNPLSPVYFEGFPASLIFPYRDLRIVSRSEGYLEKWSAEIQTNEEMFTVLFLLMRGLGEQEPLAWNTRESHQQRLKEKAKVT